jgi:hypothetical protein
LKYVLLSSKDQFSPPSEVYIIGIPAEILTASRNSKAVYFVKVVMLSTSRDVFLYYKHTKPVWLQG